MGSGAPDVRVSDIGVTIHCLAAVPDLEHVIYVKAGRGVRRRSSFDAVLLGLHFFAVVRHYVGGRLSCSCSFEPHATISFLSGGEAAGGAAPLFSRHLEKAEGEERARELQRVAWRRERVRRVGQGARARSYRAHSPYHHTTSTRVSCGGEGRGVTAAHFACSR